MAARRSQEGHINTGRRRSPAQRHLDGKRPRSRRMRSGRSKFRNSGKVRGQLLYLLLGQPRAGVTRKCCASLTRNAQSDGCRGGLAASAGGGPDQGARGAGPRDTLHGTPSRPNHPPQAPTLDVGTLQPPGTNGRDNTPLDARRCCSRGIICERACARTC